MTDRLDFFTPIGRFVNGSITEKRTKDSDGRMIDADKQRFEFGVAFPKADIWPLLAEQFYPWIATQAARDQNATQRLQSWFSTFDGFSMKIADGDRPNQKGQYNENTRGCFVMYFSSSWAPQAVDPTNQNINAELVKRGFYVQVAGNITTNGDKQGPFQAGDRAGIYLNGSFVRLVAEGDEIRGGPDAATAFGGAAAPTALPPGARPLGTTSGAVGAFGGAPQGFQPGFQQPPQGGYMGTVPAAPALAPMAPAAVAPQFGAPPVTASGGSYPQVLAGPPTLPPLPPR
jgi:hypothetical protein